MNEAVKVLIVDDIPDTRENIRRLLAFNQEIRVVGEAENGEEAVRLTERLRPDIVLMDINMPVMDGISATEAIASRFPETAVIMLSVQGEHDYLRKAMLAGAKEYLVKPFSADELLNTILTTFNIEQKRRESLALNRLLNPVRHQPTVVTVFSSKGGVGKTTIATNLAVAIAQRQYKVALIDLDLQFGDVAIMLNLLPQRTISELVQEIDPGAKELIGDFLFAHSTGIRVLAAPLKPEYAEFVTGSHVEKIITTLRQEFDYIVIDTPGIFHDTVLAALDSTDQILLVTTLDLPTIKNVKLCLNVMESLNYPKEKIKLVLNKASGEMGLKYQDVEAALEQAIKCFIPSDERAVLSSVNQGVPFVVSSPHAKVTASIEQLAHEVGAGEGQYAPRRRVAKKNWGLPAFRWR